MSDIEQNTLVAFPPVGEAFWSGLGPVGLLRYRGAGVPAIAVTVRATSPLPRDGEPFLPGMPVPLAGEPPSLAFRPLLGREMVPYKPSCDVGLCGSLTAQDPATGRPGRGGSAETRLEVGIGEIRRAFSLTLSGEKVDLAAVRAAAHGGGETRLGPHDLAPFEHDRHFHLEKDAEMFRSADPDLRFDYPTTGSRIFVRSDFLSVDAALGFEVFVRVDYRDGTVSLPLCHCDTITFHLERAEVDWIFRAVIIDPSEGRDIERVVVAAFAPGQTEERSQLDSWLVHSAFCWASGPEHVASLALPEPLGEEDLTMARYSTWDAPHFASTLPLEEVAQIQVELQKGRNREAVLKAHGLSDYQWNVEERAAMDRLSEAALSALSDDEEEEPSEKGPQSTAADLQLYQEARERALAETPYEGRAWSIEEYAKLRVALETQNPIRALETAGLGAAELVALDFEMEARMEADPEARAEYDKCYAGALASLPEGDTDDFSPQEEDEGPGDDDEDTT